MKIYLENRLLVQSRVFDHPREVNKLKRNKSNSKRNWMIYTWNSKNKLSFEEDGTSDLNYNTIEASLRKYKTNEEFKMKNIPSPDYFIQISGYSSFIPTTKRTMKEIIKKLEKEKIDCLLSDGGAPVIPRAEYISPRLKKKLKNPLEIKL